jgi:hypothetical protein
MLWRWRVRRRSSCRVPQDRSQRATGTAVSDTSVSRREQLHVTRVILRPKPVFLVELDRDEVKVQMECQCGSRRIAACTSLRWTMRW